MEALVRWDHPVHGLLPPDRFIPLAEQTDLIEPLTTWVIRSALADAARFGAGDVDATMAVNVSARNLARTGFAEQVVAALQEQRYPPAPPLRRDHRDRADDRSRPAPPSALDETARRRGVRSASTTSVSARHRSAICPPLPIDELKIDRSFIADMLANKAHAAIVRSIVDLGHNLGFHVVGEGVEDDTVLGALAATGCDVAQGYLIARPMPADELIAWLDGTRRANPVGSPSR